jgi:hypothetical protein
MRLHHACAMLALALVSTACGGDSSGGTGLTTPTNKVGAKGGTVTTTDGTVALAVPAGALSTQTTITIAKTADPVSSEHVVGGTVYEFGPSGTQFAQPITMTLAYDTAALPDATDPASLRIGTLVGDKWEPITEGLIIDSVNHKVSAKVSHFSAYAVVRDPCTAMDLGFVASDRFTVGLISREDCLYTTPFRRSDYYTFGNYGGNFYVEVTSPDGLVGLFGVKAATSNTTTGLVYGVGAIGQRIAMGLSGALTPIHQVFISGQDSSKLGSYKVTVTRIGDNPTALSCGTSAD